MRRDSSAAVAGTIILETFVGIEVQHRDSLLNGYAFTKAGACSSVGRAPPRHGRGPGFESRPANTFVLNFSA